MAVQHGCASLFAPGRMARRDILGAIVGKVQVFPCSRQRGYVLGMTPDQELAKDSLTLALLAADVQLKEAQAVKAKQDWRLDPTRVIIQAIIAAAAVFGAIGTVVGTVIGYLLRGSGTH